jgi:acyl-CoA reductase-like NAD-dependent aldehyde dehydrogenase
LARASYTLTGPASGAPLGQFAFQTEDELLATLSRARSAQPDWAALTVDERLRHFRPLPAWVAERADELAGIVSETTGKTPFDALATEVLPTALAFDHCLGNARRYLRPARLRGGSMLSLNKRNRVHRVPWGVVGVIAPWNYPLSIPIYEISAALIAGNCVVFKTAPETQPVGELVARIFERAGLPAGVFNLVNLDGPVAGETMLGPGGVDKLSFTGSVPVGKWLAARAAERLVPVTLELGGKDAMIVCDDANLERAANGAVWAGMQNAGQTCAAVERIYCHHRIHDRFMQLLKDRVERLRIGTDIGSMCTPRQAEKVRGQLDEALAAGATVAAQAPVPGHLAGNGNYLPATVLTGCNHGMRIVREETFGPVLVVMSVDDDEQAVEYANESDYGLTASVWTMDRARGRRIADRLQAGVVTVNDHLMSHGMLETPWGGFKLSGTGRTHGRAGFEAMTQTRVVIEERLPWLERNAYWYPVDDGLHRALRGTLNALYADSLVTRLRHLPAVIRLLSRMFRRERADP